MKFELLAAMVLALALAVGAATANEDDKPAPEPADSARKQAATSPAPETAKVESAPPEFEVYRPPERGKPRARIGGGVRGVDRMWPAIFALVPAHAGQTLAAQPSLFWYLDALPEPDIEIIFTLMDEAGTDPLVEKRLSQPTGTGIQRIDLAPFGVKLEAGHAYEWSVALVEDREQRSQDLLTVGWIDRVEAPGALATAGGKAGARDYAAYGLWYDALTAAEDGVRAAPQDPEARATRDALLRQVGLGAAVPAR
jgi:hypothetical protein